MTGGDRDPILDRLRQVDPASVDDGAEASVRESVKRRGSSALERPSAPWPRRRKALVLAGAGGVAVAGAAVALFGGGNGIGPGADPALAIERGPNGVTLTIEEADASADEMNRELQDAGIDRVRVISVPGSPNHAGTWGGTISLSSFCEGGTRKIGFGIRIAYHPDNGIPAPAGDFFDLKLPRSREVGAIMGLQSGAGKRAIVSKETIGDPEYAPAILIAIHPRSGDEPETAKQLTPQDLIEMGGVFEPFGHAMADGRGRCSDLGLNPLPPPTFPPSPQEDWVAIRISGTRAGAERMTDQLRAAGIDGRFRRIPAQPEEVGHLLGFDRVPPFPPDVHPTGNRFDLELGDPTDPEGGPGKYVALRIEAFQAWPDDRWVFYLGRPAAKGEAELVVGVDGPQKIGPDRHNHCKGSSRVSEPDGDHWCASTLPAQIPRPEG